MRLFRENSIPPLLDLEYLSGAVSRCTVNALALPAKSICVLVFLWGVIFLNSTLLAAQTSTSNRRPRKLDASQLERLSLAELELRMSRIDSRLEVLAKPSMRMGSGAVGYRSKPTDDPNTTVSIQVNLEKEQTIDQIVLVPAIWRDTQTGFRADGFPLDFKILAGTNNDRNGKVCASYTESDGLLPRVAPLIVECPNITASWVRIEATKLSRWAWDNRPVLQLSEVMVFKGNENLALRQNVEVSSDGGYKGGALHKQYLVDGFVPYFMDAQQGKQSVAFVSQLGSGDRPTLTIDLESIHDVNQINLHSTDLSDSVPQSVSANFGVPLHLLVEGATSSDFSDAVTLFEFRKSNVLNVGPIIMRRFPVVECRYVRLTALTPYTRDRRGIRGSQIGFAEIEIFSNGKNVSRNKRTDTILKGDGPERQISAITDGNNLYGQILPIKTWLGELALRHDYEVLRPGIFAELRLRYQRQRTNLIWLSWLAGFLAVSAIVAVLVGSNLRDRAVAKTREQIAADLHDELGANCHAIGLLSDLAQASADSPDRLRPLMRRVRELTQRTGMAATHCVNMLESQGLFEDLEQDMRRSSDRLMADLEHDVTLHGREFLSHLSPSKRIGVLLFYKESLTNIIRHSGATKVITDLNADAKNIRLCVIDNGYGQPDSTGNGVPGSLRRRARLLGAQVSATQPKDGGTKIELNVPTKQPWFSRIFSWMNV